MSTQLYALWLPDAAIATSDDAIRAQIQQAGLLEAGGLVSQKISTDQITLSLSGQWRLGEPLSKKHADEAESLGASNYSTIPLFGETIKDRVRGYYEVERVEVNPAKKDANAAFEYTILLAGGDGHETHWRASRTGAETISTNLATGTDGEIAINRWARKVRWFDPANGTEAATVQHTETGDYATVDFYDPTEPTFSDPSLIYELDYERERFTDIVVYDDHRADKEILFATQGSGFQYDTAQYDTQLHAEQRAEATGWTHVYHPAYQFDGRPVVDTGRLRVRFDESAGEIVAWQYDGRGWAAVDIDHTDYDLFDADIEQVRPADVQVFSEWEKTDGTIDSAVLSFQRGQNEVVVRIPDNESSVDTDLESLLTPIASDATTDPMPAQDLIRRSEVK